MAYQQVSSCRFFIDHLLWLKTLGMGYTLPSGGSTYISDTATTENLIGLNPTNSRLINPEGYTPEYNAYLKWEAAPQIWNTDTDKWKAYIAVLGHNSSSAGGKLKFYHWTGSDEPTLMSSLPAINYDHYSSAPYDGFTLAYDFSSAGNAISINFDPVDATYSKDFYVGCISHGNYFYLQAPNLSLTPSIEYAESKEITTYNGSSMSNTFISKQPNWGSLGAWELNNPNSQYQQNQKLARSGRRSWSLKFSFIDSGSLFGPNQLLSDYLEVGTTGYDADDVNDDLSAFTNNLLTDDNFFSQVWSKTLGGTLPFILQPNKDENTFAICRFKDNSLKATQTAPNVYDISLKIEETW